MALDFGVLEVVKSKGNDSSQEDRQQILEKKIESTIFLKELYPKDCSVITVEH